MSAIELRDARARGELSAQELVSHALERIETLNPVVSALVTVTAEQALDRARQMDEGAIAPGVLWGLPFADKDLTRRAGVVTGAGSKTRKTVPPETESDPIATALDDAGGISVGKTAVCEFGFASYTESDVFAPTRSPYAPGRGAGGSSGGAAAAVASGMLALAPGSDGGGSVRIPAWSCGVVGHKPSRGLIPAGTGFDSLGGLVVPGPIARSVADAALILDAMAGDGRTYRATRPVSPGGFFLEGLGRETGPLRIGLTTSSPWDEWADITLDPAVRDELDRVAGIAEALGHRVERFDWRPPPGYADAFHTLWSASAVSLEIPEDHLDGLEPLTRHLVEVGQGLSAAALAGALQALSRWEAQVIREFDQFDAVMTPGLAVLPPEVGFYDRVDPERNFRQQVQVTPYTSFVNVCGLAALALPTGHNGGAPLGVQLIGRPGADSLLLQLGSQLEAECGWRGTTPEVW